MLGDWLKKLAAGPKTSLPDDRVELLVRNLKPLDERRSGLARRAVDYVLQGSDPGVLDKLGSLAGCGKALKLKSCGAFFRLERSDWERFFHGLPRQEPAFYLRLALLMEAAARPDAQWRHLQWLPEAPLWLEVFLWEASTFSPNIYGGRQNACYVDFELVESMLQLGGLPTDIPLRAALFADPLGPMVFVEVVSTLPGLAGSAARHGETLRQALTQSDARRRVQTLELMGRAKVDPQPHLDNLVDLAVSSAKTVRNAAQVLLRSLAEAAEGPLRRKAEQGSTEERLFALELLSALRGEAVRGFLSERAEVESNRKVRERIGDLLGTTSGPTPSEKAWTPELPSLSPPVASRLGADTRRALRRLFDEWHRKTVAQLRAVKARQPSWSAPEPGPVGDDLVARIEARMTAAEIPEAGFAPLWIPKGSGWFYPEDMKEFLGRPELELVHVVRFLTAVGILSPLKKDIPRIGLAEDYLQRYRRARGLSFGLRELGAAFQVSGLPSSLIGRSRVDSYYSRDLDWEPEAVWPYFAEHLEILEEALELRPPSELPDYWLVPPRRSNALAVLETFPRIPAQFHSKLWELALGSSKTDRAAAKRCLMKEPGTAERVVAVLGESRQEARVAAADWLGEIRQQDAIPALEAALRKEKHEAAKAALMGALEALGAPVDQFLNRQGLSAEAETGLKKGVPAALSGFLWDQLPEVHWADNGEAVSPRVLTWLIVQAHKLGTPEPSALLRRYTQQMRVAERENLGQWVLESWIAADTIAPTRNEVEPQARQTAHGLLRYYPGKTLEEVVELQVQSFMSQPKGSAIATKGILAVAGASAGAGAAPVVEQYLRKWYGYRSAQCRALIQMLSWIEHPTAIQLLLSIATRFRTAGVRKEAEKYSALVAERKGWSVAELGDRTIPTAGFDEKGERVLDYGSRQFVARLEEGFTVKLAGPDGKRLSSLPEARAGDSPEAVATAKKALAAAKKELKTAVKLQKERLYEAMCTGRSWPLADWDVYLRRHPIVGRHCERMVWLAESGAKRLGTFRPLGDGTLTDFQDGRVNLPEEATVRIAHGSLVGDEERRGWPRHLADYGIEPLFDQFGGERYELSEAARNETRLTDFLGHLVEAFKLRGRATALGYVRGASEDGGWFYVYRKGFATLGLEAVIEFSGNGLPEENRTVALKALYFVRSSTGSPGYRGERELKLKEVPPVLLSECRNDFRALAAEGSGFDPEWEKKVEP